MRSEQLDGQHLVLLWHEKPCAPGQGLSQSSGRMNIAASWSECGLRRESERNRIRNRLGRLPNATVPKFVPGMPSY